MPLGKQGTKRAEHSSFLPDNAKKSKSNSSQNLLSIPSFDEIIKIPRPEHIPTITLDLNNYEKWTVSQVASILVADKSVGGCYLSVRHVLPLFEANFDGYSLRSISSTTSSTEAITELECIYNKASLPEISIVLHVIVKWVSDNFKTRKDSISKQNYDPITRDEGLDFILRYVDNDTILIDTAIEQSSCILLNSFGHKFQFIGREESMNAIEKVYKDQFKLREELIIDKSKVVLPFIAAAPGIGKSRILKEMGLKLVKERSCFPIFTTFGNGCSYNRNLEKCKPIESLILRMIFSMVYYSSIRQSFHNFRDSFLAFLNNRTLTLDTVLQAFGTIIPNGQNISFYIAIDEAHNLDSSQANVENNPLKQVMSDIGEFIQNTSNHGINLFPLFSGTNHCVIFNNLIASTYTPEYIPTHALLPEDKLYLILDKLQITKTKLKNWRTNVTFRHYLRLFTGFPRGIEFYLKHYLENEDLSEHEAFNNTISILSQKYHPYNSLYSKSILYYIITRKVVRKNEVFTVDLINNTNVTFSDLENKGYIMLNPTKKDDGFLALYPPVLLKQLVPHDFVGQFENLFFDSNRSNGKSWETTVHDYLFLTLNLLSDNEKDLTFERLFPLAKMQSDTSLIEIEKIPKVKKVTAHKQINGRQKMINIKESDLVQFNLDVESNKQCFIIYNEAGEEIILGLKIKGVSSVLVLHILCKWEDSNKDTIPLEEIYNELTKNRELVFLKEAEETIPTINITVILTSKNIPQIPEDTDLIVINKENFVAYFGVFANQITNILK